MERPFVPMDDFVYWKFTPAGTFSVKYAYVVLVDKGMYFASVIWGLSILPRFKIFLWKLLHNALPVTALLNDRGIPLDPL